MNNINIIPFNYHPRKSSIHCKFYGSSASKKFCFITGAHHLTTSSHYLSFFISNNCTVTCSAQIRKYSCVKVQFVLPCWWWLPCISVWLLCQLCIQPGLRNLEFCNVLLSPVSQVAWYLHFSSIRGIISSWPCLAFCNFRELPAQISWTATLSQSA
ncbi:hypothetical protein ACJW30_08G061200 [Castanea mollissima]